MALKNKRLKLFSSILILCTGNICRSPYAEARMKILLPKVKIKSAGVLVQKSGLNNCSADPSAIRVAEFLGCDLSAHKAKQVTEKLVLEADLILAMERAQLDIINEMFPPSRSKGFLLGHWIGINSVEDPYQKDELVFRTVFGQIDKAAYSWQKRLIR